MSFFSALKFTLASPETNPTFTITFPYLDPTDLRVFREIPAVPPETEPTYESVSYGTGAGQWELVTPTQVRVNDTFSVGDVIWIRRYTKRDARLAEYFDGSVLTEEDLNSVTLQLLYLIQELVDAVGLAAPGGGPPGGNGGPGPGGTGPSIDDIINQLLQSQLFQDLIALIDLTDINAESIIRNALAIHERWSQTQVHNHLIEMLDEGLEAIDARVTIAEQTIIDNDSATAALLLAVQARLDEAEADLIQLFQAQATTEAALTTFIQTAESRFADNEARIGLVETTYASQTYVQAQITQQLDTRFSPANFNGYLNASSIIQGLLATNNAQGSSVQGITSYIAGSGVTINADGTINWGTPTPGSLAHSVSVVQTTVAAHATQLSTEAALRTALASAFSPGNASNPAALVAGIEQAWQTYADEDSATAELATTLAVSRQPIIFQATAPNPYSDPEWATPPQAGYSVNGFPNGTIWYKQVGATIRPFWWDADRLTPPSPPPDEFYGPFAVEAVNRPGMWLPSRDTNLQDVLAAQIENYAFTGIFEDRVEALFQTQLTTVFDAPDFSAVNTIAERLVSYIDEETGTMYSSWQVRINQYLGTGTPVIAGVGLGMQTDLLNPEAGSVSQFIIMADQFALIAPPEVPVDPATDPIDPSTIDVPFVVDAPSGKVIVNGTLLARSMRALDSYIGRLTVTQMNLETLEPLNPEGMRLVLPSNSNNWNSGNAPSQFPGGSNPQRFLVWAGSGTQTANNALFYIDTDGNAVFAGEVRADNMVGTVNDTVVINQVLPSPLSSTGAWIEIGTVETLPGIGLNVRVPTAVIAIALFGSGAAQAEARLWMRTTEDGEPYSDWVNVAQSTVNTETGTTLTLVGSLPSAVRGPVELKVEFRRFSGSGTTQSNRFNGIFMGVR